MRLGSLELGPGERLAVVSPHLDDAVLSLGATIRRATRKGVRVTVLTALACDPGSTAPTKGWDARAGFATEGEAAGARRLEDAAACAVLGATPRWLPFGSVDYERHGDEAEVAASVLGALGETDAILLPGTPLTHPDHAWLVRTLLAGGLADRRPLGFYAEQPYAVRAPGGRTPRDAPDWLAEELSLRPDLARVAAGGRGWLAKRRAIRRYRSQLRLLGLGAGRLELQLASELRGGGEAVAWLPAGGASRRP